MRKMTRLAGIWIVLFSFAAESTGAAGLPVLAAPMAARNLMLPPQAVLPPRAAPPVRLAPKVSPPAEWGFYVLAAGEIAVEQACAGRVAFRSAAFGLIEGGIGLARVARRNLEIAADFFRFETPASEALAPIDLPAVPGRGAFAAEPSTPAPAPATAWQDSLGLVRAPQGEVAAAGEPIGVAEPIRAALREVIAWPVEAARRTPPMAGPWHKGRGIRYRVVYVNPSGLSEPDAWGIVYTVGGRQWRESDQIIPQRYYKTRYAVYGSHDPKTVRVEIENIGTSPLRAVRIDGDEEALDYNGGVGARLPLTPFSGELQRLAPGKIVSIEGTMARTDERMIPGHFQQTHVRVTSTGADGQTRLLSDEPQAGLVDPPNGM